MARPFRLKWVSRDLGLPRVYLEDKEAVRALTATMSITRDANILDPFDRSRNKRRGG